MAAVLEPTGTCFEDVTLEFLRLLTEDRSRASRLFMCHGICLLDSGKQYSHAWIELAPLGGRGEIEVHFPCKLHGLRGFGVTSVDEFARTFRVQEFTRYLAADAYRTAMSHNDMPPPWEERYRKLCRD